MGTQYICNIAIDLEFTPIPKRERKGGLIQEIIEVGAVKMDANGNAIAEFSHLVRPELAGGVANTVRGLTGITSEDVACARSLADVLEALAVWIGPGRVRMVTWSTSDLNQVRDECAAKGITVELPGRWLDIQRLYPRLMDMERRRVALGEAADWCGINNDRLSAHRALYDAQVTAELFRMMASGECAEHRARVTKELDERETEPLCASIAERCKGLAALKAMLVAIPL